MGRCFALMLASWLYIARTDMASMDSPWVWTCTFACITIFDDLMSEKKLTKMMESLHNAFRMKYDTVEQFGEGFGPAKHTPSQCDIHQPKVMLWPATRPAHFEVGMTLSVLRPVWPPAAGTVRFDVGNRL